MTVVKFGGIISVLPGWCPYMHGRTVNIPGTDDLGPVRLVEEGVQIGTPIGVKNHLFIALLVEW